MQYDAQIFRLLCAYKTMGGQRSLRYLVEDDKMQNANCLILAWKCVDE